MSAHTTANLCGFCGAEWTTIHYCADADKTFGLKNGNEIAFRYESLHSETFHGGCSVTWDAVARAGYAHTNPNPDAFRSERTVAVSPGLNIDLDDDGFVRGIETIGHRVDIADLLAVLRECKYASPGASS